MRLHFQGRHVPEALTFSMVALAVVPVQWEACLLLHIRLAAAGLGRPSVDSGEAAGGAAS